VDTTYVLANPQFDRHSAYRALSQHRQAATVFYATQDFGGDGSGPDGPGGEADVSYRRFAATLSRPRPLERLLHDDLECEVPASRQRRGRGRQTPPPPPPASGPTIASIPIAISISSFAAGSRTILRCGERLISTHAVTSQLGQAIPGSLRWHR
jgi:hypothetical protein